MNEQEERLFDFDVHALLQFSFSSSQNNYLFPILEEKKRKLLNLKEKEKKKRKKREKLEVFLEGDANHTNMHLMYYNRILFVLFCQFFI